MNLLKDLVLSTFLTSQLLNASPYPTYAVHWLVEGVSTHACIVLSYFWKRPKAWHKEWCSWSKTLLIARTVACMFVLSALRGWLARWVQLSNALARTFARTVDRLMHSGVVHAGGMTPGGPGGCCCGPLRRQSGAWHTDTCAVARRAAQHSVTLMGLARPLIEQIANALNKFSPVIVVITLFQALALLISGIHLDPEDINCHFILAPIKHCFV